MAHILLGITGSIAAVKAPELIRLYREKGHRVTCILSPGGDAFVSRLSLATLSGEPVIADPFGPDAYKMPHLELARSGNILVVAPASASVLGRMAHGISDELVSLTYLTTTAPTVVAPALHDTMWDHPATQANVKTLQSRGVKVLGPIKGKLADGTEAIGRMSAPEEIVSESLKIIKA